MRKYLLKSLLLLFLLGLQTSNLFAQYKNYDFVPVYAVDSLKGFDEKAALKDAVEDGLPAHRLKDYLEGQKRVFVDNKFGLKSYSENNFVTTFGMPPVNGKTSGPLTVNAAPCVNEGFELGNSSGWVATRGTNANSCAYAATPLALALPSPDLQVVNTSFIDPVFGLVGPSPFTGSFCAKINDASATGLTGGDVIRISQTFPVTQSNFLYEFAYRAVMATAHPCCQQTYMQVNIRDFFGQILSCPLFTFAPPATSGTCSSPGITWNTTTFGGFSVAYNPTWQKYSIDLSNYIGSNVTIDVTVADCSPTAHWGYVYFDSQCSQLGFDVNGSFFPAPTLTNNPITANCGTSATITAPGGLSPYTWNGPPGSGITGASTQSIVTSVAGAYSVSMWPPGACVPTNKVLNLTFPPPVTITPAPSATLCGSQPVNLTASGASSYTWVPSGFNSNFITVTPTATSIYTVTGATGTCVGTFTRQITVNPSSTVNILTSNTSLCPGQVATLTALGANTYTWYPSLVNTQSITVTQTATTTYSVVGTETTGCSGSASLSISMSAAPNITITPVTSTYICSGGNVVAVAGGATNFTWQPGNITTFPAVLTAFATTNFTAIGSSGSCTNSGVLTVSVDPGPTVTVIQSPTIICPGNSATLTVNGGSALGYTWQPGGTVSNSIVVTPTAGATYSAYAVNLKGCISENTIAALISPVPSLTVTPLTPTVCFGSALTLTASGGSTYTWNPIASTGSTTAVSPTATTVYSLIGSNGTCTSSINSTVSVVPLPTLSINASSTAICLGQNATLTANGATNYTWLPGASTATTIVVTPTITTVYTLTGRSSGCSEILTITITVNNPPSLTVAATPTAICPGFTSTLSGTGAATYTWNPGSLSGASPTVSPSGTTIFTAIGASTFGCISTKTVSLVVHPNPTVVPSASSPSICAGSSATLSASGASTYVWNPGASSGSAIVVSPTATTVYSVTGTNSLGCSTTSTINLTIVPLPTVSAAASPTAVCIGFNSTLTATGASNYTWNPGALTGSAAIVSPTATTVYTLTGAAAGCSSTSTVQLIINGNPTLTTAASPTAICIGFNSTLTATGAANYTWNPGALTGSAVAVSPAATTIYTATGASTFGCLSTRTIAVQVNPTPTVNLSSSVSSLCVGSSASLTATGAQTYTWNPGNLTGTAVVVSPSVSTDYTVVATSSAGCVGTSTLALTVVPNPIVTASASPTAVCIGFSSTLTANGATNYTWSPGALTGSAAAVSPTATTVYTLVGNTAGCNATTTVQLVINGNPTITASASPTAVCPGFSSALSATGAVSFTWNPGANIGANITVTPSASGVYTVSGESAFGCIANQTLNLIVNPTPNVNLSSSSPSLCIGSSASLTATGAQTYTWNPGNLTGTAVVVSPTTSTIYTVVATSSAGCVGTSTLSILVVPLPTVSAVAAPTAVCIGFSSTLTASGATNYTWSPSAINGSAAVVSPTTTTVYTVTAEQAGCNSTSTVQLVVNPNPPLLASASPTAVCPGFSSSLSATGAVSYTWNPGNVLSANITVTPSSTSNYTVSAESAFGCITSQTVTVLVNPTPTVVLSSSAPTICVNSSASLTASGAQTYTWNPGNLTGTAVVVSPTTTTVYSVVATSSAGCLGTSSINLGVVPNPTISALATPTAVCIGFSSTLTANGATNYTWTPSALTGSAAVVSPTSSTVYTVNGSQVGCSSTSTVLLVINPNPPLIAAASPTAVCPGFTSLLSSAGAVSYTWNPGSFVSSNITVTPSATSNYTVSAESAFGCITSQTVSVIVNPTPTVSVSASSASICVGSSASFTASGAQSYTWNPGNLTGTSVAVSPTANTVYTIDATSVDGCFGTTTINLIVVPNPTVVPVATPTAICIGLSSTLTASGAGAYTWSPGASTGSAVTVSPSSTTVYTVTGSQAGCSSSSTVQLIINGNPTISASASPTAVCPGFTSVLSASGAVSYVWNPGSFISANITVTPAATSVYTVSGASAFGCLTTQTVAVVVNPTPTVNLTSSSSSICVNASASITASGAQTYTWLPGTLNGTLITVSPSVTTLYSVTATSSAGCIGSNTINLVVVPNPTVTSSASPTAVCLGLNSTLTATGASTYVWLPGAATGSATTVSPAATTIYTVTGSTAGCSATSTVQLVIQPLPSLTISATSASICSGATTTLSAGGAQTYTWLPGSSNATAIAVSPSSNATYTLLGSSAFGCTNSAQRIVTVSPTPSLNITITTPTICLNQSKTFTVSGATSYTTAPGAITGSVVTVSPTGNTTYTVTGLLGACSSATTQAIVVNPLPTLTVASTPTNLCTGSSASLSANGAVSYTWQPVNLTGSTVVVAPLSTTIYTVSGTSSLSCVGSQTLSQLVSPTPSMVAAASQSIICFGNSTSLTATGAVNYTWSPGALTGSLAVVNPTSTTTYTLLGNNGSICSQSITITVTVNALPTVTAIASATAICFGNSATLTANGASTYTWLNTGAGSTVAVSPTTNTNFVVIGTDANNCSNSFTVPLVVNANPTLSSLSNPTVVCSGSSASLSVSGAVNYTWLPAGTSGSTSVVNPTINSTYTVIGSDNNNCTATTTVSVATILNPTISLASAVPSICVGQSNTLTASGAVSYTWSPGAAQSTAVVVNPTTTTIYTVIGTGTNVCQSTTTLSAFVNPLPGNLTAAASSTISCATPTVTLNASSSSTPVTYVWAGPNSFTSNLQNPGGIVQAGSYTVVVTNTITGCVDSITTSVIYDNSIPSISITISPSITCADAAPVIFASNTTTNAGYVWTGPNSFSSTAATPSVSAPGNYTVVLSDLSSTCTDTAVITVGIHTAVVTSASFAAATCSLGTSSNNGSIQLVNYDLNDRFALVSGTTFTGALTYTNATGIPTTGLVTNTIANPSGTVAYTLRIFDQEGCTRDTTFIVVPVDCQLYSIGVAKAVSVPQPHKDGSYSVTYTITAKNYDAVQLTKINLTDNLSASFPAPCTFSIEQAPSMILGTGLTLNESFDGVTNTSLTAPNNSSLNVGDSASFKFTIRISSVRFTTTYLNTVLAAAIGSSNVAVRDSSNNGFDTKPKLNVPTPLNFVPSIVLGLTKEASVSSAPSGAFDITYTITAHNLGNDTLRNVSITDDLSTAIPSPARFSLQGLPVAGSGLTINTSFGAGQAQLTSASESTLLPGQISSIVFTVRILPDTVSVIINSANASAIRYSALNPSVITNVSDVSNNGNNADTDDDLICNEELDNMPTVVVLPLNLDIFVPQGFSPDADGINDQLIIKGLPKDAQASISIFNRWGVKVFNSDNYADNDPWDGHANVGGTLGQGKLPQGTYYYVLSVSGSVTRTLTGFIVLQY